MQVLFTALLSSHLLLSLSFFLFLFLCPSSLSVFLVCRLDHYFRGCHTSRAKPSVSNPCSSRPNITTEKQQTCVAHSGQTHNNTRDIHTHTHEQVCPHTHTSTHSHKLVCTHVHTHRQTGRHTHTHTNTHTHTHTAQVTTNGTTCQ